MFHAGVDLEGGMGSLGKRLPIPTENGRSSAERAIALLAMNVCARTYSWGAVKGHFVVSPERAKRELVASDKALLSAIKYGSLHSWLRRKEQRIVLSAAGVYIAKLQLSLPT
jgi:hypothetical protein